MEKVKITVTVRTASPDDFARRYQEDCVDLSVLAAEYSQFMEDNGISRSVLMDSDIYRDERTMDDLILEISGDTADAAENQKWVEAHPGKIDAWVHSWVNDMPEGQSIGEVITDCIIDDVTENMYGNFEDFCLLVAVLMCQNDHNLHYLPKMAWKAIKKGVEDLVNSGDEFDTTSIRSYIDSVL